MKKKFYVYLVPVCLFLFLSFLSFHHTTDDSYISYRYGAIGFYSDMHVIDILGLIDKKIAKLMHKTPATEYADYIIHAQPKYILLNNRQYNWDDYLYEEIYKRMFESGRYRQEKEFSLNGMKKLILFVRKD